MKSDAEIREDVINELRWDPQISDPDSIGVAVKDGAVTLTGHTPTYAGKLTAAQAAERVYGVKAVANDTKVKLTGAPRDDTDIARAIAHLLEWNTQVPVGRVHARVQDGWVTLDGEVDHDFERREVERMVGNIRGVIGVTNAITVRPPASPQSVETHDRGSLQARGRGRRTPYQGGGNRPHREALRACALDKGGERGGGRSRLGTRNRPGGEPSGGLPLARIPQSRLLPGLPRRRRPGPSTPGG